MGEGNSVTITGKSATLYWGYFKVGVVSGWTATRSPETATLTATVVSLDTFRASQRPIVCVVQHQHGVWRWTLDQLQITGETLTASISQNAELS